MKIPKKITPDSLKHTIIQVLFNSSIPPELVIGIFHYNFKDDFEFITGVSSKKEMRLKETNGVIYGAIERGYFLDKTKKVKVNIGSNALIFNSYEEYVGWDVYYPLITKTIINLFKFKIIDDVSRIGIRYISQFDKLNFFDGLKVNLSIDLPNRDHETAQIRSEFIEDNYRVILTLISGFQPDEMDIDTEIQTSVIDIDIIQLFTDPLSDPTKVVSLIEKAHIKQKSIFFSLLKQEFLESLNPEY